MDNINVGIRVRPLNEREIQNSYSNLWMVEDKTVTQISPITMKPLVSSRYTFGIFYQI